jgi:hypothetical protein
MGEGYIQKTLSRHTGWLSGKGLSLTTSMEERNQIRIPIHQRLRYPKGPEVRVCASFWLADDGSVITTTGREGRNDIYKRREQ